MAFTLNEIKAANAGAILRNNPNGGVGGDYDEICTVLEDPNHPGEKVYFEERLPGDEPTADTPRRPIGITHPRGTICKYAVMEAYEGVKRFFYFNTPNKLYEVIEYGVTELCYGSPVAITGNCYHNEPFACFTQLVGTPPQTAQADLTSPIPEGETVPYGRCPAKYIGYYFKSSFELCPVNATKCVVYAIVRPLPEWVVETRTFRDDMVIDYQLLGDAKLESLVIYNTTGDFTINGIARRDSSGTSSFISQPIVRTPFQPATLVTFNSNNRSIYYDSVLRFSSVNGAGSGKVEISFGMKLVPFV
jgi:hypothetical protein